MTFIYICLTVLLFLDCVFLVFLMLLQLPKKEAGAGMAFGGGGDRRAVWRGIGQRADQDHQVRRGHFLWTGPAHGDHGGKQIEVGRRAAPGRSDQERHDDLASSEPAARGRSRAGERRLVAVDERGDRNADGPGHRRAQPGAGAGEPGPTSERA